MLAEEQQNVPHGQWPRRTDAQYDMNRNAGWDF